MHLDTDQALLHHLVAADGGDDVRARDMTSPVGVIVAAIATLVTLVAVMAMCVCRKNRPAKKEPTELVLKEPAPVVDSNQHNTTTTQTHSPVEETEVKVTVDTRNSRHSNGSVVMGKDAAENGRPKSHDQRALPEIPAGSVLNGVMQTDDEDDDEGHYDVISRRAMAASLSAASVSNTSTTATRGLNLYEKVGTGGSDMSLTNVVKVSSTPAAPAQFSGLRNNPYATVDGIGSADYAHIDERAKSSAKAAAAKAAGGKRVQRVAGMETQSAASTDTLNDSYASVPPPPVPDKNFAADGGGVPLSPTTTLASISPQNSPGLPLRNSVAGGPSATDDGATASTPPPSAAVAPLVGATAAPPSGEGVPVMEIYAETAGGEAATGKREPPYSSVTARESLANLRQRQAMERQQLQPLPHDATYESVNYEQMTTPPATNLNTMTSDRNSLTSDLYAEIASGSGENSTRSSVYAKVGDVSGAVRETPAPTPPPMDFLLKHLPKESAKSEEELPDPGYSIIRRARPVSAHSAVQTPAQPRSADKEEDPEDQPVYAVVDKSRRNRNTVCVSEDINRNLDLLNGGGGDTVDQLYAQVNKQRGGVMPPQQDFSQGIPPPAAASYVGTGARPKIRSNGNNNPVIPMSSTSAAAAAAASAAGAGVSQAACSSGTEMDPAYQTLPSDENTAREPGYEDIEIHNQLTELTSSITDFDPNYECVHTVDSMRGGRLVSPGVATEISASEMVASNNPHGMVHINDHHVDSTFWQRQEHVYQEIGSAQRQFQRLERRSGSIQQVSTDL